MSDKSRALFLSPPWHSENRLQESIICTGIHIPYRICCATFDGFTHGGWEGIRGTIPYLKVVRNFCALDPLFDIFRSCWVPFLLPTWFYWPLLSAENISLSLSHLVPEIIGTLSVLHSCWAWQISTDSHYQLINLKPEFGMTSCQMFVNWFPKWLAHILVANMGQMLVKYLLNI